MGHWSFVLQNHPNLEALERPSRMIVLHCTAETKLDIRRCLLLSDSSSMFHDQQLPEIDAVKTLPSQSKSVFLITFQAFKIIVWFATNHEFQWMQ